MKLPMAVLATFFAVASGAEAQHYGIKQRHNSLQELHGANGAQGLHREQMMMQQNEHRQREQLRSLRYRKGNSWGGYSFRRRAGGVIRTTKPS
jgi:hypothetical protein